MKINSKVLRFNLFLIPTLASLLFFPVVASAEFSTPSCAVVSQANIANTPNNAISPFALHMKFEDSCLHTAQQDEERVIAEVYFEKNGSIKQVAHFSTRGAKRDTVLYLNKVPNSTTLSIRYFDQVTKQYTAKVVSFNYTTITGYIPTCTKFEKYNTLGIDPTVNSRVRGFALKVNADGSLKAVKPASIDIKSRNTDNWQPVLHQPTTHIAPGLFELRKGNNADWKTTIQLHCNYQGVSTQAATYF